MGIMFRIAAEAAAQVVVATDQFFANVVVLMTGDAANSTITETSQYAATVTSVGSPQISASTVKYGPGSMYFNGTNSYVSLPASSNYTLGTADFTIECWVYPFSYGGVIVGGSLFHGNSGSQTGYCLNIGENQSRFRFISNGGYGWADTCVVGANQGPALNVWSHVAVVRNGTSLKIYVNGVQAGSTTIPAAFSLNGATRPATVGYFSDGGTVRYFNGFIDDLRVTKGVARYTEPFTPPIAALPTA